jgi:hypothetical protein
VFRKNFVEKLNTVKALRAATQMHVDMPWMHAGAGYNYNNDVDLVSSAAQLYTYDNGPRSRPPAVHVLYVRRPARRVHARRCTCTCTSTMPTTDGVQRSAVQCTQAPLPGRRRESAIFDRNRHRQWGGTAAHRGRNTQRPPASQACVRLRSAIQWNQPTLVQQPAMNCRDEHRRPAATRTEFLPCLRRPTATPGRRRSSALPFFWLRARGRLRGSGIPALANRGAAACPTGGTHAVNTVTQRVPEDPQRRRSRKMDTDCTSGAHILVDHLHLDQRT